MVSGPGISVVRPGARRRDIAPEPRMKRHWGARVRTWAGRTKTSCAADYTTPHRDISALTLAHAPGPPRRPTACAGCAPPPPAAADPPGPPARRRGDGGRA